MEEKIFHQIMYYYAVGVIWIIQMLLIRRLCEIG
nr:MAG TPA: hypothetical protein [Caudoviricetes sp.]